MTDFQDTLDRLTTLPMFHAERPATASEILKIEAELGLTLPAQYRAFLQRFGYASSFGQAILGILPIDPITGRESTVIHDCVSKTQEEQAEEGATAHLPKPHVVIAEDGGGGNFVLFSDGSPFPGQVHWYNFEDSGEPIEVWASFQDYLEYRIREGSS